MGINLTALSNFWVKTKDDAIADGNDGSTEPNSASMVQYNEEIGNKNDTKATSDTGTFSLIALVKRILADKLAVGAQVLASSLSVTIATDDSLRTNVATTATKTSSMDTALAATKIATEATATDIGTMQTDLATIKADLSEAKGYLAAQAQELVPVNYAFTRPATITAYTIGDMVNDDAASPTTVTFNNVVSAAGGTGRIVKAVMTCSHNTAYNLTLHLFKAAPTTAGDNLPNTISDADLASGNYLGAINFPAMTAIGVTAGAAGNAFSQVAVPFDFPFTTGGTAHIYGAFTTNAATTPVASAVFTCTLLIQRS